MAVVGVWGKTVQEELENAEGQEKSIVIYKQITNNNKESSEFEMFVINVKAEKCIEFK